MRELPSPSEREFRAGRERSQSLERGAWLAWPRRFLRPRLLGLRLRDPPFWMLVFECLVCLSRFCTWIQPGECGSLSVKGLCFPPPTALRIWKSQIWGSDDPRVAVEKGKYPGFGGSGPRSGPRVRGAGGLMEAGVGGVAGPEQLGRPLVLVT